MLLALAEQNNERLKAKLEVHEENAENQAERALARLGFDFSPEGEALRNYLIKCTSALFRGMANYRKYQQARTSGRWDGSSGVGQDGTQHDRSEDRGRQAHASEGSELGADDSFGPEGGEDDHLERADMVDAGEAEPRGDLPSGMGEIGENAPSEANFDESMSVAEAQESNQVTPISGALSGLDNALAQPGEGSTTGEGEAVGSGFESGGAKLPTPTSSGRAKRTGSRSCADVGQPFEADVRLESLTYNRAPAAVPRRGSLPAAVSKREKRGLRRENERRAVERMVEEKPKAGNFSLVDILATAMAPPRGL